ncbi:unnamed protein product, partial [Rotaria sp. Silwood1]
MATSVIVNRRLLESVRDEPKKMLLPISGYEKVNVKTLDEACDPIKHMFGKKLQQYITIAKMNSTEPKDGLNPDESAAIHLYTIEWDVHENSLYMILNRTLRLADRTKLQPWFKHSQYTLVWRGVREDLSDLYPKGKEFAWWAFSSCTASMSALESPNYLGKLGARTMFSIQTNSGKDIRAHSYFENEDEILLPPGIYLKVIDSLNPAEDLHIIHLREVSPPYQMIAEPFDLTQLKQTLPQPKPILSKEQDIYPSFNVTPKPSVQALSKNS